jgi:hypothetical protein
MRDGRRRKGKDRGFKFRKMALSGDRKMRVLSDDFSLFWEAWGEGIR